MGLDGVIDGIGWLSLSLSLSLSVLWKLVFSCLIKTSSYLF